MTNRNRTLGALALVGAGAAILAPQALAHPNLEVDTAVSCEGVDYTVTGIDAGTSVTVKTFHQVNGFQNFTTYTWKDSSAPHIRVPLPPQYRGTNGLTVTSTIESEGVKDAEGPTALNCAPPQSFTPPPPPPKPPVPPRPPKPPTPPPPRRPEVCAAPAKLRIVQQQTGTFYTEVYPISVRIRARADYRNGGLVLSDAGLQNFVKRDGSRTERLVVPIPALERGETYTWRGRMGFTGPQAYQEIFRTDARYRVGGKPCGHTSDWAYEG